MKLLLRYAASGLRPRAVLALFLWSIPETLPTAAFGFVIARALDDGFLNGRPWTGAAWLAGLLVAAAIGAFGTRGLYAYLGVIVESFRDRLVRHVICHALQTSVDGQPDTGAVSRLARQVEIARDSYAGVILAVRGTLATASGVTVGLLALDPLLALIILPPFLLGLFGFIATLGFAAERHRRAAEADERLAERVAQVAAAVPDLAGCGGEDRGAELVAAPIARLAAAERALAGAAALRAAYFAVGGWLPLLAVLAAAPWLADRGLTAGALTGALLYILTGLQPALTALVTGLGGSGLRLCVALSRILGGNATSTSQREPNLAQEVPAKPIAPDGAMSPRAQHPSVAAADRAAKPNHQGPAENEVSRSTTTAADRHGPADRLSTSAPPSTALIARGLTFAYGPHAAPAVAGLDLTVSAGDHLAIIGPSGIGKSTLAALLCGLLRPDSGTVAYSSPHRNADEAPIAMGTKAFVTTAADTQPAAAEQAPAADVALPATAATAAAAAQVTTGQVALPEAMEAEVARLALTDDAGVVLGLPDAPRPQLRRGAIEAAARWRAFANGGATPAQARVANVVHRGFHLLAQRLG